MKLLANDRKKINISTALLNQMVTTICGILVPRILLGAFGSDIYGISVSVTQFLSYIALLESGIGGVARAEIYGPLANGDLQGTGAVYHAIKRFFRFVALAFIVYSFVLGIAYKDIAHVEQLSRGYLFALVIIISLSTLAKYMGGLANLTLIVADRKQYVNNLILTITTIANTVAVIVLVNMKTDILWVKLGSSLIFVLRPILYGVYVRKHYILPKPQKGVKVLQQKWTGIGQHIAFFLHTNTDVVLLTLLADTKLVAVYSVYNLVISSIRAISESFSSGMEAEFGKLIAKNRRDELRSVYQKYKLLLSCVTLLLFGCTGILIVPFVKIYTSGITDANYIQPLFAVVLLLAEAINCVMLPCSSLAVAANHIKQTRVGAYGEAAINVVLSLGLIFWDPLLGVAVATLVATFFKGIFYMVYAAKNIMCMPVHQLLGRFVAWVCILCGVIFLGRQLLVGAQIGNYIQWICYGAVIFVALCVPIGAFYFIKNKKAR